MPDDLVTIDPQFQRSPPGDGQGRWLRLAGIGAGVVVAFMLGWLLRTPGPGEPELTEAASTSTPPSAAETTTPTTRSRPSTTTTTLAEPVGLPLPLGEAVPGFTDTMAMTHSGAAGIDVLRWSASQSNPETIASVSDQAWFFGLDASGRWVAQIDEGVLFVDRVPLGGGDVLWLEGFDLAVDVRVASAVWHDTDPGRLAWVQCSLDTEATDEGLGRVATLYSFDLESEPQEAPKVEETIDGGCVAGWGISPSLQTWGSEGVHYWTEADPEHTHLIRSDGTTVALPLDIEIVTAPNGWAVVIDHGPGGESHLLAPDGTTHPIPGLAENESFGGALWSPDGALLAYVAQLSEDDDSLLIRIVGTGSGSVVAEVTASGHEVWPVTWSTDSRYLLLEHSPEPSNGEPSDDAGGLLFYDVSAGTSVTVPLPREVGDIRTFEPTQPAEQITPVQWMIDLNDYSGAQTVAMVAEVLPLTPDQVADLTGTLVWNETVVDLCNIEIREVGDGFVHIGDIFGTDEGCGANPTAMFDAFDTYGMPETACLAVEAEGVEHEYCAPLN